MEAWLARLQLRLQSIALGIQGFSLLCAHLENWSSAGLQITPPRPVYGNCFAPDEHEVPAPRRLQAAHPGHAAGACGGLKSTQNTRPYPVGPCSSMCVYQVSM